MAGSRFAYVRDFELPDPVLPNLYLVVRVDGKGFHRFSAAHGFAKPNDAAALELMNQAARHVCMELKGEVTMAFGESDEYSFLLRKSCRLYNRRQSKITTHIVSLFTSAYVFFWPKYFPNTQLQAPPSFDGRLVQYPTSKEVRDYFSWRQADTHINNLYNTTFWSLVLLTQPNMTEAQAHHELKGTVSSQKHEILFSRFGINYEQEEAIFRKGTTLVWSFEVRDFNDGDEGERVKPNVKPKKSLKTLHVDIIGDAFWSLSTNSDTKQQQQQLKSADVAPPDSKASISPSVPVQPWQEPDRLKGTGAGASVLN